MITPKLVWVLEHVWRAEGSASDHPNDRGGLTNRYGITERVAERYGYTSPLDIDRAGAEFIALHEVWLPLRLEDVESRYIAHEIFDTAWLSGQSTSVKILQRAANLVRLQAYRGESHSSPLAASLRVDGRIGPLTIESVNYLIEHGYEKHLYHAMNGFQFVRFTEIVQSDRSQGSFIAGWMVRLARFKEMLP